MLSIIFSIFSNPAFIIGFIALIGLVSLKKDMSSIIKGTTKTILGFIILQQGANLITTALLPFSTMFTEAFGLTGIIAEDNALIAAVQTIIGQETALILVFSFIINILIARFTRWKYIYLTGHMMFAFAGTMAIVFQQMGLSSTATIVLGSVVQGISMVFFPAISQPFVRRVTGSDEIAFGFLGSSWIILSGWIGGLVGNKSKSSEDVKVPQSIDFLKEMSVLMSLVMIPLYITTFTLVDEAIFSKHYEGESAVQFAIDNALLFVAGILILLYGVQMFLAEIVPAFKGIGEKIVPGARPALDVPVFFPYAPIAVTIGFLGSLVGGIIATFLTTKLAVTVLPSVLGLFFIGAAAGVFGNASGGRRGAIVAGLFFGFTWTLLVAVTYPLVDVTGYGVTGLWFGGPDLLIVIMLIHFIKFVIGLIF